MLLTAQLQIVEEESATLGWPDEVRVGIDGNHRSMVCFADEKEPRYRQVSGCISRMVAEARLTVTGRLALFQLALQY